VNKNCIKLALVALCTGLLFGCSHFTYTQQGAVIGAVVGAGVGAGFGQGPGALLGAAAGGLAGGLIGHEMEVRRHTYPPFTAQHPDYVAPSYCIYPNMPYPMVHPYAMPHGPPPPGHTRLRDSRITGSRTW